MRLGLVVNPIAGMGGRVGLKGTDGKVETARERGAEPRAPDRASESMAAYAARAPDAEVVTGPGQLGADAARAAGYDPDIVGDVDPARTEPPAATTADDTRSVVAALAEADVDFVLFVGGDGTAVDVADALAATEKSSDTATEDDARTADAANDARTADAANDARTADAANDAGTGTAAATDDDPTPMLGVPAGVKIYSSVFAVTPREAGRIAAEYERVEERELNDIDEDAYRDGAVETELRAIRPVPVADGVQASKQLGGGSVEGLVEGFLADLQPGTTYVFGPGSTVGAIEQALGIDHAPLGVDVWRAADAFDEPPSAGAPPEGDLLVADGRAATIREATIDRTESGAIAVVVSPIGGQGFVFGRGNQQIAPDVIRAAELAVVGSRRKLDGVGTLRVDTGDSAFDDDLRGWQQVRIGRVEHRLLPVE